MSPTLTAPTIWIVTLRHVSATDSDQTRTRLRRFDCSTPPLHAPADVRFPARSPAPLPTAAKCLVLLLFALNAGSWSLVWHLRDFSSVIEARDAIQLFKLRHLFASREKRAAALKRLYESCMPIGVHPFRKVWTYRSWVSIDDSDFNLHMSNSSYAKVCTGRCARFPLALATFPSLLRCGGFPPFLRPQLTIVSPRSPPRPSLRPRSRAPSAVTPPLRRSPALRRCPLRSLSATRFAIAPSATRSPTPINIWVVSRFVKPPSTSSASKNSKSSNKSASSSKKSASAAAKSNHAEPYSGVEEPQTPFIPSLKTPATPLVSGATTPVPQSGGGGTRGDPSAVAQALLARAAHDEREPDGAVLYNVFLLFRFFPSSSLIAYAPPSHRRLSALPKTGPAGHSPPPNASSTPSSSSSAESSKNADSDTTPRAPPYWSFTAPLCASMRALRAFYAGGWREESWWE
ncbi:hypothetical protein DFH09DRAFT_1357396 [Mycena vulgaris]|nr:hypothetical protein DFH09DRAFT_1357396 [Mycena vulgaris]